MRLMVCLGFALALLITARAQDAKKLLEASGVNGGLIIHIGCGDGSLTAELGRSGKYVVRGLAKGDLANARRVIAAKGLYGRVSVTQWDGKTLPFLDNLVNLVVTESSLDLGEVARVLAPRGVALIKGKPSGVAAELEASPAPGLTGWTRFVKKVPNNIDEWTHWLHGPDNNAVAKDDVVGPPGGLQWVADPIHLRSHEHLNSITALVSTGGRIFYIIDEGPVSAVASPPKWRLVARDAFNGLLLWKREIGPWERHFRLFRSGPPEIARRLAAVDGVVYVTLGYNKKVAAFDAVTGAALRTYEGTEGAMELLCEDGRLYVVVGEIDLSPPKNPKRPFDWTPPPHKKGIVVLDAKSGKRLWKRRDESTAELMPTTLGVLNGHVCYQNTKQVVCMDAATGKQKWTADRPVFTKRLSWSAPVLVMANGVVLSADGSTGGMKSAAKGGDKVEWIQSDRDIRKHPVGDVVAFDVETGKKLWSNTSLQGFCNPGDLFVIRGKVWSGADVGSRQAFLNKAIDLKTGKVVSKRPANGMPVAGHTRCYRNKATEKYLVLGDTGIEFVNTNDWSWNANSWVRGTCQYGVMPCNGLVYAPSDSCACRPEMRLHGFSAMAPQREIKESPIDRLLRGPAYDSAQKLAGSGSPWPTYRSDGARSGMTKCKVPTSLGQTWETKLGGKLSAVTIGNGKVYVAQVDTHAVHALDLATGKPSWSYTAGACVDSPPTLWKGLAIFGSHDGFVYCVKADDGKLVWRFRAGPTEQQIIAMENIASLWPVNGSVLIKDDLAWFVAGRSSYLDGGLRLWALEPATGKIVVNTVIDALGKQSFRTSRGKSGSGTAKPMLPDILSTSDGVVYMRWMGFDAKGQVSSSVKPHLFSATGFLDDTWWHRTYWQYGTWMRGGFGGWPRAGMVAPAGRIMAANDTTLFSYGRSKYDSGNGGNVHAGHINVVKRDYQDGGQVAPNSNPYKLFSVPRVRSKVSPAPAKGKKKGKRQGPSKAKRTWESAVPMYVRSMVLAGDTLFIAGPPADKGIESLANVSTAQPGILWAVSSNEGKKLSAAKLPACPVFDGLAAAPGKLLSAGTDGVVRCFEGK